MSISISQSGVILSTSGCLTAKTHDGIWNKMFIVWNMTAWPKYCKFLFKLDMYCKKCVCVCRFLQFWLWYPNKCNWLDLEVFGCLALFECTAGGLYRCSLSIRQADKPAFLLTLPLIFVYFEYSSFSGILTFRRRFGWIVNCFFIERWKRSASLSCVHLIIQPFQTLITLIEFPFKLSLLQIQFN